MSLSRDEAKAEILLILPGASDGDVESFLAGTDDDRAIVIQTLKDAGVAPDPSTWSRVIAVLKVCADLANLVMPIETLVGSIYGLAKQ